MGREATEMGTSLQPIYPGSSPKAANRSESRTRKLFVKAVVAISLVLIAVGILVPGLRPGKGHWEAVARLKEGHVRGNTYYNKEFGLQLKFPRGWYVLNEREMDRLRLDGARLVSGDERGALNQAIESKREAPFLLFVMKYPPRGDRRENASLILIGATVEGIESPMPFGNGKEFLEYMIKSQIGTTLPPDYRVTKRPYPCPLGGCPFFRADFRWNLPRGGGIVRQSWLAQLDKKRLLMIICSWTRDRDRSTLESCLKTFTTQ
jgi:hypothetical protein